MTRSLWKGPYFNYISNLKTNKKYISRASVILPSHLNKTFEIHNGKRMVKILILSQMIGRKFGEFVKTKIKYGTKN
jgi:ribosomal protein S19